MRISLDLRDARMETLWRRLGGQNLSGRLAAQASLSRHRRGAHRAGPRGDSRWPSPQPPVLAAVAAALDLPHLRDLRFQEGIIDFTLAGDVLRTPVVRFVSGDVKILGKGEIQLGPVSWRTSSRCSVPPAAVRRAPKEMRSAFTDACRRSSPAWTFRRLGPISIPAHGSSGPRPPRVRGVDPAEGLRQFLR